MRCSDVRAIASIIVADAMQTDVVKLASSRDDSQRTCVVPLSVRLDLRSPSHARAANRRRLLNSTVAQLALGIVSRHRIRSRPDRNPMSPPQLPAHRPVAFLAEPVEIALRRSAPARSSRGRRSRRPSPTARARPSSRTTGRPGTARSASCCGREWAARSRGLRSSASRPAASMSATTASRAFVHRQAAILCRHAVVERAVGVQDVDRRRSPDAAATRRSRSHRGPA